MAYGARLESGLGASPQGFESPILRHLTSANAGLVPPGPHRRFPSFHEISGDEPDEGGPLARRHADVDHPHLWPPRMVGGPGGGSPLVAGTTQLWLSG